MQPTFYDITITEWFIIIITTICCLYDLVAKITWGDAATISCTFQRLCEKDYKVGVIAGLIFAHVFLSIYRHTR
jgi:hypothetical protein